MKKFLNSLKNKIEQKDEFGKSSEEKFLKNFRDEFSPKKESLFNSFGLRHGIAACVLIVATFSFYKTREVEISPSNIAAVQLLENEALLSNMDILEELEEFEELSDEDWDVLLGDAS